ncbi:MULTISPECIES: hypothetical protein [Pseudomonas syringae group]|uniref:Imidazole glycerol phosphate synthase n=3 Tax=Pseudomonas syringae group TaxID=136849 RepID=A0AAD0GR14_9PSED|nr:MULTISPECIES: hypothetical protein [Pseudomonas syringae group]AVB20917.1 hypothetical protein BKM03_18090 [Pseudomonas avellanae]EGH09783.1 hypothetical protein PSYMP_10877 [Pseudomonas amygdali pv. morsprunorum str. M302280]KWS71134.1 hypothetical protein AL055_13885 [Pseudomonas amygdali pv. morsprunorum]PHN49330.1 hypothetical protein AO261_27115 [Pseudomonas avellanae]POC93548.1 hypothetical protein BKM26_12025 [Pseudomonas avellanae]
MAGHSADSLLAWMQGSTQLRGWDAIVAIDSKAVNDLLAQTYQTGVGQGLAQPVPDGSITIPDTNISHYFSGLVLGPPALSFEHSSLESAPVAWRMSAVSGIHTVMENNYGRDSILKMFSYDPSGAAGLRLDTQLTSQGPALAVDLGLSENVELDFSGSSPAEQRQAGKFVQAWLLDPANRQRVFTLGVFGDTGNPLLNVRRIDARTQLENADGVEGRGALLLFTTLEHGATGGFPDNAADFRYLIPSDTGADYSATAVFSSHALHRAALGHAVMQALQGPDFEFILPPEKPLGRMVALAGELQVASESYTTADFEFESTALSIPAVSTQKSLTIDFDYSEAMQSWSFPVTVDFRYKALNSTAWQSRNEAFNVNLQYALHLLPAESGDQVMQGHFYAPYEHNQEVSPVAGRLDGVTDQEQQQINGFVAHTVKHSLTKALGRTLQTKGYDSVLSHFDLGDDQVLKGLTSGMPHDLAVFGKIDSAASTFRIVEQQALVVAGAQLQMTTLPARTGLVWSVENPPGSGGSPGKFEGQGIYHAPDAPAMTQAVQRVLVTASDPDTLQRSTTLVTVQADAVSINPLIQVCNYGERVSLLAGAPGDGKLIWSIVDRVPGESGTLEADADGSGGQIYVAGPKVTGKTYLLDEVAVSDGQHTRSAWVLVRQNSAALTIEAVEDSTLGEGEIRLQARSIGNIIPGVEWWKPDSMPGSFAGDVYKSDLNALDRFVVIFARLEDPDWGEVYEGHVILPLPLNRSAEMVQKLLLPQVEPSILDRLLKRSNTEALTQGWDAILAVSRDELNKQLEQQYVERHQNLSFFPPLNGVVALDELATVRLNRVELGVPSVSMLAADSSSVTVTMSIVAGRYTRIHHPAGEAPTVSASFKITEAMDFWVEMSVPLQVDCEGNVTIALNKGYGFTCNLAGVDEPANVLLAAFFAAEFKHIAQHRAVFVLLGIDLNRYTAQSPASFRVLTQSAPGARDAGARNFGEGALVLLIRIRGGHGDGQFPLSRDFPYPIPANPKARLGQSYGASLILSREMRCGDGQGRPSLLDSLRFGAGAPFAASVTRVADDLLMFGTFEAPQATITPLFSTIMAGQTQSFTLRNGQGQTIAVNSWQVISLQGHTPVVHGTITSSGVYTAASVTQMGHDMLRVVVSATYDDAGKTRTASALLGVLSESMEIAPRVMVVAGRALVQPVLLKATTLGGAQVRLALQGAETGTLTQVDGGMLFKADARSGKRTLSTQQLSVEGDAKRLATVLIANGQQTLRIEPNPVPRSPKGVPVQLRDDSTLLPEYGRCWKVIGGEGTVDAQGLFTPLADFIGSCVVSCEISNNEVVLASGYAVIEVSDIVEEPTWTDLSLFTVTVPGGLDNQTSGSLYPNGYQQLRIQTKTQPSEEGSSLSVTELATMHLVDNESGAKIYEVTPPLDGIPEGDPQTWLLSSLKNRFDLSLAGTLAVEPLIDTTSIQNFYLHSRAKPGYVGTFHATFQQDGKRWWTSVEMQDQNSKILITPRTIPVFDTGNYDFKPTRAEGSGGDPTEMPPADWTTDDPFTLNFRTTDYWKLSVRYPSTQAVVDFEMFKYLPESGGDAIASMILWESEQKAETFFSWTGYAFDDTEVPGDVDKIKFDAALECIVNGAESLDLPVKMNIFESGKLIISLHRTDSVPFISVGDPGRDKLYRSIVVSLLDKLGNIHRRRISFLSEGTVGRRNRLVHTLYTPT